MKSNCAMNGLFATSAIHGYAKVLAANLWRRWVWIGAAGCNLQPRATQLQLEGHDVWFQQNRSTVEYSTGSCRASWIKCKFYQQEASKRLLTGLMRTNHAVLYITILHRSYALLLPSQGREENNDDIPSQKTIQQRIVDWSRCAYYTETWRWQVGSCEMRYWTIQTEWLGSRKGKGQFLSKRVWQFKSATRAVTETASFVASDTEPPPCYVAPVWSLQTGYFQVLFPKQSLVPFISMSPESQANIQRQQQGIYVVEDGLAGLATVAGIDFCKNCTVCVCNHTKLNIGSCDGCKIDGLPLRCEFFVLAYQLGSRRLRVLYGHLKAGLRLPNSA